MRDNQTQSVSNAQPNQRSYRDTCARRDSEAQSVFPDDVVSVFPDVDAVMRVAGSLLIEIHDEWQAERRYFSLDSMAKLKEPQSLLPVRTEPLRLAPIRGQGSYHDHEEKALDDRSDHVLTGSRHPIYTT